MYIIFHISCRWDLATKTRGKMEKSQHKKVGPATTVIAGKKFTCGANFWLSSSSPSTARLQQPKTLIFKRANSQQPTFKYALAALICG
ncbi:hypothetical protein ACE6H2_009257 [Prunus campanulata]